MDILNSSSNIPVDDYYFHSNCIDEDTASSAFSIASSKYNFAWENGRLYHNYKSGHPFPYDETSQENERILHSMMLFVLDNRHFVAPLDTDSLKNVLDVGHGLGLWAEEMAEAFPDAQIIGLDTSPQASSVIPNCEFITADVTEEWVFNTPDQHFDFIHIRLLTGLRDADWPPLYKQCFDRLESGGWLEQVEVEIEALCDDGTAKPNSQVLRLVELSKTMSAKFQRSFHVAEKMRENFEGAGLVDIQEFRHKLPLGWWSTDPKYREIGRFFERYYKTGLEGWLMHILTSTMGYDRNQVIEECMKSFEEIDSRKHHYYMNLLVMIGRKP